MKKRILSLILICAFVYCAAAQSDNSCDDFQKLVKATYNFKPSELSSSEQTVKSAAMDKVWEKVKNKPTFFAPCLRELLIAPDANRWFLFDGSCLLVEVDPSKTSKQIEIDNLAKVDFSDVQLRTWVEIVAHRGFEGFDVSKLGELWLACSNAEYYLPEHGAYKVDKGNGALFIYGSMDESLATPALLKTISDTNSSGREISLQILMSQATTNALQVLTHVNVAGFSPEAKRSLMALLKKPDLIQPRKKPKSSREEYINAFEDMLKGTWKTFDDLVEKVPDGEKDVVAVLKPKDLPLLRKVRRLVISKGNQHMIEYYNSFTQILMTLTWKSELVANNHSP